MNNILTIGKRSFFFIATNLIIVCTLGIVGSFFLEYLGISTAQFYVYLVFYSVIGVTGALVSLWLSKWQALKFMGVHLITAQDAADPKTRAIIQKIQFLSKKAGLPKTPDFGIYKSHEVNAFATGPSKKNSLVAVSTGLLSQMNETELEGVLAHEISHIANGDMVTMTLVQAVVNVMVNMIAHIIASFVSSAVSRGRNNFWMEFMFRQFFAMLLYIPGSMLVCFFSRWREYRADYGGACLAGRQKMISALQALSSISYSQPQERKNQYSYLKINNAQQQSVLASLFQTHPPIKKRIQRLIHNPIS